MKILLTGASGFIGRNVATALLAAGHCVIPVSRRSGVDFRDMLAVSDWLPHLAGIEAVINAVGIIGESPTQRFACLHAQAPLALFQACAEAGVRRVIQISALGTDDTAFSAYHRSKRLADDGLRRLDLDWFVLRPSLIYGRGGGSAELFMRLARLPWQPVPGDGRQIIQPVHIGDVVASVRHALTSPDVRRSLDILGRESFTFGDWLQTMRQAQGLPPAPFLRIPLPLARLSCRIGRHFTPLLQPENLLMLLAGYQADYRPWANWLGRMPLPVEQGHFFCDATMARRSS